MQSSGPDETKYCEDCGQTLRADAQFCDRCGATQQPDRDRRRQPTHQQSANQPESHPSQSSSTSNSAVSRRGVILASGIVSVGVIGGGAYWLTRDTDPTFELAADPWLESDSVEDDYRSQITGRIELEQGEYATRDLDMELDRTVELRVTVDEGTVDVGLFPKAEFQRYRDQEDDPRSLTALSQTGVSDEFHNTADVLDGEYTLVFDNTAAFGSNPDGLVTTDVMFEARLVSKQWFEFRDSITSLDGVEEIDVSNDRAQWYVLYEAGDLSENVISTELREILLGYPTHIPDSETHTGIVLDYRGEAMFEYEVSKELATQYQNGELTEEEYFDAISEGST